MTAAEAIGWTTLRAAIVAGVWLGLAPAVAAAVRSRAAIVAAALPVLTPTLLIGYIARPWVLDRAAWVRDAVHAGYLVAITLPLAVLACRLLPPAIDARGWAMATRSRRGTPGQRLRMLAARHRPRLAAAVVAFVWTMQEAELGILLQARGWPEWTRGQTIGFRDGLLAELWPAVAIQLAAIGAGVLVVRGGEVARDDRVARIEARIEAHIEEVTRWPLLLVAAAVIATTVLPLALLAGEAVRGAGGLLGQRGLTMTLAWSVLLATVAALAAWGLVRVTRPAMLAVVAAAGTVGSLLVAIGVQSATRAIWPAGLGTPIPHTAALVLTLVPKAIVLMLVVRSVRDARAVRAAQLLGGRSWAVRRLEFALRDRPTWIALAVLAWTAYFDAVAAVVLAAPAMQTTTLQLYNFAHFNQILTLAAGLLLATAVPLGLIAAALAAGPLTIPRR